MIKILRTMLAAAALSLSFAGSASASLIGLSSSSPGTVYSIDPLTGAATALVNLTGASGTSLVGLEFLGGTLYATDVVAQVFSFGSIDLTTGAFTPLNTQDGSPNWHGLAANESSNVLYTVDFNAGNLLKTVTPTGVVSTVGATGVGGLSGLAYDNSAGVLYGVSQIGSLYTINTGTGAASFIGGLGFSCGRPGLTIDPTTGVMYLNTGAGCGTTSNSLFTVNKLTGAATLVGANGVVAGLGIDGLAFQVDSVAAVPEPTTLLLLGSGLAAAIRRRRRSVR